MKPQTPLSPEERALDRIVAEAKDRLAPKDLDWSALESKILAEAATPAAPRAVPTTPSRALQLGAIALAAAAAFLVVVRSDRDPAESPLAVEPTAGALRSTEGAGEVRVAGISAPLGQLLHAGDVVEAEGARAVFERPRKVTWILENDHGVARARVKSASDSLVVALEEGAIEAQVVPVPNGEAFAVDLATASKVVRVAVHGTHLRVTRTGDKVSIDLSEGVLSIGTPPRSGSTYGTLVTAPAHAELDAADLEGTLKVEHGQAAVKTAVSLPHLDPPVALAKDLPQSTPIPKAPPPVPAKSEAPPKPEAPKTLTRDAIVQAVKDCAKKDGRPGEVKVTISSTLRLKVAATGEVTAATFDPPLAPEIQTCAASTIYKGKLEEGGALTLPIEITY